MLILSIFSFGFRHVLFFPLRFFVFLSFFYYFSFRFLFGVSLLLLCMFTIQVSRPFPFPFRFTFFFVISVIFPFIFTQVLQQGSWLAEYYVGAKKTFYSVEFSPAFTGVIFGDAVVHIFELFEVRVRVVVVFCCCCCCVFEFYYFLEYSSDNTPSGDR